MMYKFNLNWIYVPVIAGLLLTACTTSPPTPGEATVPGEGIASTFALPKSIEHLHWLGDDSFRLDGPPMIYFDPEHLGGIQGENLPQADMILITHDHTTEADVDLISGPETVIIGGPRARVPVEHTLQVGERMAVGEIEIEATPLYGDGFHPQAAGDVGFIVTIDGERIYYAGHTHYIPEMADIRCDVALLPAFEVEELARMANAIQPKIVVVMHTGTSVAGAQAYVTLLSDLYDGEVVALELER